MTAVAEIVLGEVADMVVPEIKISYHRSDKKIFGGAVTNPQQVADFVRNLFPKGELELQEQFFVLYLDQANKITGYYKHSKGTMTSAPVDIRLVLGTALKSGSVSIILAHNHPSGTIKPSDLDKMLTSKIKTAAASMDIIVLDHLIITKDSFFSFSNEGLMGVKKKTPPSKEIEKIANTIIEGDSLKVLKTFPDESIDCVITSPPYWQLRDYGFKGQWGLEKTYMQYLENMLSLMDEIYRVLKPEGTVWVNLGDSYFGSGNGSGKSPYDNAQTLIKVQVRKIVPKDANNDKANNLRTKCLTLIPHRFACGCVERGWIVRNDIIWAKPNSLPESVRDRFSKKHEHILFLTKNPDYYFDLDAVRDPYKASSYDRVQYGMTAYGGDSKNTKGPFGKGKKGGGKQTTVKLNPKGKNPGDITDFWVISTKRGAEKHYATFNTELITKPILAGCPEGGIILDPFCGTGTTGVRAIELGRNFIGIDGKKEYCGIARKNINEAIAKTTKLKKAA
jgi:DNA modification methylase